MSGLALSMEELRERFDYVGILSEGLARVRKSNKWWHIRSDGSAVYEERFDLVGSFSKGLAWVQRGGKKWHIRPDGSHAD